MIKDEQPRLVEFNVRFGDPECQILMRLLESDILPTLDDAAHGRLSKTPLQWSGDAAALIVLAAKGYPGPYEKGSVIRNTEVANKHDGVVVFHAGTAEKAGALVSNGGRVLNVTATASSISVAVTNAYKAVDTIDWPEGFYRRDIAWRAMEK